MNQPTVHRTAAAERMRKLRAQRAQTPEAIARKQEKDRQRQQQQAERQAEIQRRQRLVSSYGLDRQRRAFDRVEEQFAAFVDLATRCAATSAESAHQRAWYQARRQADAFQQQLEAANEVIAALQAAALQGERNNEFLKKLYADRHRLWHFLREARERLRKYEKEPPSQRAILMCRQGQAEPAADRCERSRADACSIKTSEWRGEVQRQHASRLLEASADALVVEPEGETAAAAQEAADGRAPQPAAACQPPGWGLHIRLRAIKLADQQRHGYPPVRFVLNVRPAKRKRDTATAEPHLSPKCLGPVSFALPEPAVPPPAAIALDSRSACAANHCLATRRSLVEELHVGGIPLGFVPPRHRQTADAGCAPSNQPSCRDPNKNPFVIHRLRPEQLVIFSLISPFITFYL